MNPNNIHPEIKEAIRHGSLIFFVGSGYSKNLSFPDWKELTTKFLEALAAKDATLREIMQPETLAKLNPKDILSYLLKKDHKASCQEMLKPLMDIDLSKRDLGNQKKLWSISEQIITTNFDLALESALSGDTLEDVTIISHHDKYLHLPGFGHNQYLFKIHGSITDPLSCIMFDDDYDNLYKYNHKFLKEIRKVCANSTLLFIGYSISDIELRQILKNIHEIFDSSTRHFIITPSKNNFKKYGVETILIDSYADLPVYLDLLKEYKSNIDANLNGIEEDIKNKYGQAKDLIDAFSKQNEIFRAKDNYIVTEDLKDILTLETLEAFEKAKAKKIISDLVADKKEDLLKKYLLVKREARMKQTRSSLVQLEDGYDSYSKDALKSYSEALEMAKEIFGVTNAEVSFLYNEIGTLYLRIEDYTKAEQYFKDGLRIAIEATAKDLLSSFYNNLGTIENNRKNLRSALDHFNEAVKINNALKKDSEQSMRNVGSTLMKLKEYKKGVEIYETLLATTKPSIIIKAYDNLALAIGYRKLGQYQDAIKSFKKTIALLFSFYGQENKDFVITYNEIGYCYTQIAEFKKAIYYYKKVLALESNQEKVFIATNNLGETYFNAGMFRKARETFQFSLSILKKNITEKDYPEGYRYCNDKLNLVEDKLGIHSRK